MHVCGDFGTSGFPGTFKIFFTDVVVNMARSMLILTLPMPVFVDDMGLIGAINSRLEREWERYLVAGACSASSFVRCYSLLGQGVLGRRCGRWAAEDGT